MSLDSPTIEPLPKHLAVIMDGNGRWARERGENRLVGHKAGVDSVIRIVKECARLGIPYLTLYTFSTENWKRSEEEVSGLMKLLALSIQTLGQELIQEGVRLDTIGDISALPDEVQQVLEKLKKASAHNDRITVILALNYGSRQEITEAARRLATEVQEGALKPEEISEELFAQKLYTAEYPDPDLLIRSSGEFRLSNYLLWQLSYAEFYISECYWPDFDEAELAIALSSFNKRQRRYGGVKNA